MPTHLMEFDRLVNYDPNMPGISVDAKISFSDVQISLKAKIDTGSTICIFERVHGEKLGLKIESGLFQRVKTATGSFTSFGFRLGLSVAGLEFVSLVYFAEDTAIRRNVLGRHGWLEMVRLGLIDYERKLYLSKY